MERKYVRALKLHYRYDEREGILVFEDGVKYTLAEAVYLSKRRASDKEIDAIHKVKQVFGGEIICRGTARRARTVSVPIADDQMPEPPPVPVVRTVEGKPDERGDGSCQMLLDL